LTEATFQLGQIACVFLPEWIFPVQKAATTVAVRVRKRKNWRL